VEAGEKGLVWSEEEIATYLKDPTAYLKNATGNSKAKSGMAFKLAKKSEDVAAYLASVAN
jgi:cytochrome c